MRRRFTYRALVWACALVIVTGATAMLASSYVHSATTQVWSNGGARQWVAFDPGGRNLGSVQFLSKIVRIVNASNVPNTYSVTYEPTHVTLCAGGTLAPGDVGVCGLQPTQHLNGGYFQVIAAQPVLVGGYTDVPVMRFAQTSPGGAFGADPSTGVIQYVPLVWQQGCPPRPGSGCPDGAAPLGGMPAMPAVRP